MLHFQGQGRDGLEILRDVFARGTVTAGCPLLKNAVFINEGLTPKDRLIKLNQIAIQQMSILEDIKNKKLLK